MSDDIDTNMSAYKKRHAREIDNLFRANNIIQSQVAGTDAYRRGHVWNFEWCSEDPAKAKPKLVAWVKFLMDRPLKPLTFEEAFDAAYRSLTCEHAFESFEWSTTRICKTCGIDESNL